MSAKFDAWIDTLTVDVVEAEYGYEPGEFTVYPEHWRPLFNEGLTPSEAFKRALQFFDAERKAEDAARVANWKRIQAEDAAAIAVQRAQQEGRG